MRKFVLYLCLILCTVGCTAQLPLPEPTVHPTQSAAAVAIPRSTETVTAQPTPAPTSTVESTASLPTSTPRPISTPSPTTTPSPTPPTPVSLAFVGDIMLSRRLGDAILAGDTDYPFGAVADRLRSADYTIGNLETALASEGIPAPKAYTFLSPPVAASVLADVGFDLMALANNHALDYGEASLHEGMALLAAQNVATVGAGRNSAAAHAPHIVTLHGVRIGFLSYVNVPVEWRGFDTQVWRATNERSGLAWGTVEGISADVAALVPTVDHVIVMLHSGYEYQETPSPIQYELSHAATNAGARLVVGHHAHVLQGVETTQNGTIVYGLGNFAFDTNEIGRSAILHVTLSKTTLTEIRFTPVFVQIDGKPIIPDAARQSAILDLISEMSSRLRD